MTVQDATIAQPAHLAHHGFVTRAIHWVSAGLIAYGYAKGLDSVNQLSDPALWRFEVAFASLLGAVFVLRWFWTHKVAGATRLSHAAPWWEQTASRMVHYGLYSAVFGVVGSGLGIAFAYRSALLDGVVLGGFVALHEAAIAVMPVLIVIHIAGALWHRFVRRDQVMQSMTGL